MAKINKYILPIGTVVRLRKNNIHNLQLGIGAGTKAKVVAYNDYPPDYPYVIEFLNKKHKKHNRDGPFMSNKCFIMSPALEVLFGEKA